MAETGPDDGYEERFATIQRRLKLANKTFTPMRPVQTREIFAGRTSQLFECLNIVDQVGAQGILYGDRGVGKTSIANMVNLIAGKSDEPVHVAKIECTSADSFPGIIRQAYQSISVEIVGQACGFNADIDGASQTVPLASLVGENASFNPKHVASVLKQMNRRMLFILDEFDRLDSTVFNVSAFTELMKILSDTGVDAHFLVVGVGESVDRLIGNHASIVRNLNQIKLSTMENDEITQIIDKGLAAVSMEMTPSIISRIVDFSCGYPHYTHLLCLHACSNAIRGERDTVEQSDLSFAISRALSKAQESVRNSYHAATMANRQNIYKEVLQACGQAKLDEYSTFVPKDVEKPLSSLLKKPIKVNQFGSHLINLCRSERGAILVSIGERGRARYRFRDPLMRAFVRLNGATLS